MKRYAWYSDECRELLTFRGLVIVHDNRAEMEFIKPWVKTVECPRNIPDEQTIPLRFHPDMAPVRWPLSRKDFD